MERKIENRIFNWIQASVQRANAKEAKALIVIGQRQVGKTFSIRAAIERVKYSANHRPSLSIELNFEENPEYKEFFAKAKDSETVLENVVLSKKYRNQNLARSPYEPLILFLDEIQACPEALVSLKFLAADPGLIVIASGSLLGVALEKASSFPVGYVDIIQMHQLDFEEFLWARGYTSLTIESMVRHGAKLAPLTPSTHEEFMNQFREYLVIGGMPFIVDRYAKIKPLPLLDIFAAQRNLLTAFRNDVAKYAESTERTKALECFDSIPRQLAKDNRKFTYKVLNSKARASTYESSIAWLQNAGMINKCIRLNSLNDPLAAEAIADQFKIFLSDTGLLLALIGDETLSERILKDDPFIYKGAIYENVSAQCLSQQDLPLYYFTKDSGLEIDFVIAKKGVAVPLEIKSSDNTKSKSLVSVIEEFKLPKGFRFSSKETGTNKKIVSLPLYLFPFIKRLFDQDNGEI